MGSCGLFSVYVLGNEGRRRYRGKEKGRVGEKGGKMEVNFYHQLFYKVRRKETLETWFNFNYA